MTPLAIVKDLQIFEDSIGQFDSGLPWPSVQQFDLHATPERLDHRVIEAIAHRTHRWEQSRVPSSLRKGPGGELGALVIVDDRRTSRPTRLDSHAQRVGDQAGCRL